MSKISIVVSVYNEEGALPLFYKETKAVLDSMSTYSYEMLFVNDGSVDGSRAILDELSSTDSNVKVVHFSRNFGHEAAMIAGVDHASGDIIICMDADLQHPPTMIPKLAEKIAEGYDIIDIVRTRNRSAGIIKNITSSGFYAIINTMSDTKLEKNASDFFAFTKRVADVLRVDYREKVRFLRGYVQSLGFRRTHMEYEAADRVAGSSKYSIKKLFRFSMETIMCFSNLPLKLGIYMGNIAGLMGLILLIYTLITRKGAPSGYATTIVFLCIMFAILFYMIGIIGQYIGILFAEIKGRPIYIVDETRNI